MCVIFICNMYNNCNNLTLDLHYPLHQKSGNLVITVLINHIHTIYENKDSILLHEMCDYEHSGLSWEPDNVGFLPFADVQNSNFNAKRFPSRRICWTHFYKDLLISFIMCCSPFINNNIKLYISISPVPNSCFVTHSLISAYRQPSIVVEPFGGSEPGSALCVCVFMQMRRLI